MRDIACVHSQNGQYEYVTASLKEVLGYSPYDFFHPDDKERIRREGHEPALQGQITQARIEYSFKKKDDSYLWLETLTTRN